jgi:hypothetical protein
MKTEDYKPYTCLHGHKIYASKEQFDFGLFCREPERVPGQDYSVCGLPMFLFQELEED